jgi:hypothetical protein
MCLLLLEVPLKRAAHVRSDGQLEVLLVAAAAAAAAAA